jgi:hypothetical protein
VGIDEIIKVSLSTPMVLNISSYKFYENLFMSIPIKWQNEISRFLRVDIEIQDKIILHEYFLITMKFKNISIALMDLELDIGDFSNFFNGVKNNKVLDYKENK